MRHGQRDVESLPRRLAAIGDEEVARRRAAALELFDRVDYASGAAVDMLLDRFAALVAPGTRSRPGPDVSVELVATGPLRVRAGTQDAARAKQCLGDASCLKFGEDPNPLASFTPFAPEMDITLRAMVPLQMVLISVIYYAQGIGCLIVACCLTHYLQ